ncbi:effector binding domain-containing protein [Cohnella sp.]|uniref:effector binding domain-containing protein n=1 Tax=Cohnella sp. TaxID=1883426 RepID=UPI0035615653
MSFKTRIVWKEPFKVVGQKIRFTPSQLSPPSENEISLLWQRFNPRGSEIRHYIGGSYGLCVFGPDMEPGKPFDYIAAAGVSAFEDIPGGMTAESFPGGLYCVVQRRGPIDEIGKAFGYYREDWLPNSPEYECGHGVEFEYYDERYKGNDNPDSVMELWFPIRRKKQLPIENRVASLFVHVTDLRRAAEWYNRLLGLPLREERLNGGPVYWYDFPGTGLILDSDIFNRANPEWSEKNSPRIMFAASGIDEAYSYLKEKANVLFEPERHGSMAYFNFSDPEGNVQMACWAEDSGENHELPITESPVQARISGAFIDVMDMKSTAAWYTDLLGLPLDERIAEQTVYTVPVTKGASLLLDQNRYLKQEPFSVLFMFNTDNIQASYDYAATCGMEFHCEIERHGEVSFFILKDPDENLIMVCQMQGSAQ